MPSTAVEFMGYRVRRVLAELVWKQVDLLQRVPGLDAGTLSALILRNGKSCQWSDEIAAALGVEHGWLQRGEGRKPRASQGWPFRTVSLDAVLALPEAERARIEGYIAHAVDVARAVPPPYHIRESPGSRPATAARSRKALDSA